MPRRIVVLERAVVAVGVQVQAQRVAALAGVRVLLQETRRDRVVHARIEVVHARLGIVLVAREKYVVVRVTGLFDHVANRVVVIGRGDAAVGRDEGGDVRVGVVQSSRVSGRLVLKQVRAVYVSAGDIPAGLLENGLRGAGCSVEIGRADGFQLVSVVILGIAWCCYSGLTLLTICPKS